MKADETLRSFAAFLDAGWEQMVHLLKADDRLDASVADWLQANWEVLVEDVLLPGGSGYLEVYGDGAECYGASSRVFRPNAQPTHQIICLPSQGETVQDLCGGRMLHSQNLAFWGFVHWDGRTYDPIPLTPKPKFNAVLVEDRENVVIGLDGIEFQLARI